MKLHHIGIASNDLNNVKKFIQGSFSVIKEDGPIWDPNLKANLMFFQVKDGASLEIVSGPIVQTLLKKNINLYHICYEVEDLKKTLSNLRSQGASLIKKPTPAILFNNRLVTFIHTPMGLIELLEK